MSRDDGFNRQWIIENGVPIVENYGDSLTIRALYYRLVAIGMTNSVQHYKRVVAAMAKARWENLLSFDSFRDLDRETVGRTPYEETYLDDKIDEAKRQIRLWMKSYGKNKWENQPNYIEVFIEKKALQGVFEKPCRENKVALSACKGYPSLTFLHESGARIMEAVHAGKEATILYFGDYDPSGEDIPRSLQDTLDRMGVEVKVERILLLEEQVLEWNLPPAPTKVTDSRTKNWGGLGQVELDAVEPRKLRDIVDKEIRRYFDEGLYDELSIIEEEETEIYRHELKSFVEGL